MQPTPPPPPVGQFPWPQPPPLPPSEKGFPILIVVLVIVLVIGLLIAAFLLSAFLVFRTPVPVVPSVTLGQVGFQSRNATFAVTSVSTTAPIGFFRVNLQVDSAIGTIQRIELNPRYATLPVQSQQYRVYFLDAGSNLTLGVGDRFVVTGNGTPLPASTAFTFYILWILDGSVVGSTNWSTQAKTSVAFGSVTQSSGNATIGVVGVSQAVEPSYYTVNLRVGSTTGTGIAMPTIGGAFVTIVIGGTTYRVYWIDIDGQRTLSIGDSFKVTGDNQAPPAATTCGFYLLWEDGSPIQNAFWQTP